MSDLTVLPDLDAGAAFPTRTMPKVLCCLCGVDIDPNPANMCVNCLRNQVDITEGIPKQIVLHHCRGCDRYLRPPWCAVELESRELLAICLKKITGLNRVRLVDAGFIWTEPHSRRIKVKLVIQKEVLNGVRLQQVFAIEFVMQNQQCDACQRSYTDHTWRAMVQVRQRVEHKRTFFLLEQLILKHRAHEKCINVEQVPAGVDFSFGERSHALKFIDFLSAVVPIRTKAAKQLISEDVQSAIKNYKFSYAAEIVPLCRDDLVVLPAKTAATMGAMNPLCLVQRVSNHIFFLDPRTLQMGEMPAERYWAEPFRPLMGTDRLEEFTVLDVRAVTIAPLTGAALRRKQKGRAPASAPGSRAGGSSVAGSSRRGGMTAVGSTASATGSGMDGDGDSDSDSDGADSDGAAAGGAGAGAGASAGPARTASGSSAASVGSKRRRDGAGGGGADVDDRASTLGASSLAGGSTFAGGFTGAVSLAGGSIQFHGASSVASTVTGGPKGKMLLAEAEIIRTRDLEAGRTDTMTVRTHLGNVLQAGDLVLAFDLTNAVYNEADAEASSLGGRSKARGTARASSKFELPDAVIVRKTYRRKGVGRSGPGGSGAGAAFEDDGASTVISSVMSGKEKRKAARAAAAAGTSSSGAAAGGAGMEADGADESAGAGAGALKPARAARAAAGGGGGGSGAAKQRLWKLRRFDDELPTTHSDATRKGDEERREAEFEAFLREIEDDPALRKSLNLYKDRAALEAAGLAGALAGAGAGGKGAIGAATRGATAAAPSKVKLRPTSAAAGAGGAAAAGPKLSAAERLAAAARLAAGDDDGDDDDGGEGPPDIDLAELLDEMSLGTSTAAAGAADDAAAKAAAPAAAASSSSAGGAGAAGSAPASAAASAGTADADADAAGAYVDPEDAKLLAQYKAREARMKRLAGAAGSAAGGDEEDDGGDDGGLAAAAAARAAAAAKAARKGKAGKRRDTGAFAARGGAAGRGVALVPETVAEEDGEGEDDEDEGEEGGAVAPSAAAPAAAGDKA